MDASSTDGEWAAGGITPMRVTLKLFATYRRYLPPDSQGHTCALRVPAGTRVEDVLARVGISADGTQVLLVNGRTATPERELQEGDVVAAFPAMAGG